MQQLELFPKEDLIRYAMSFTSYEFAKLKEAQPREFYLINAIRATVHKHNAHVRHLEKRLAYDLSRLLNGDYHA